MVELATDVVWQSMEGRGKEGRLSKWWAKREGGEEVRGRAGVRYWKRERGNRCREQRGGKGDTEREGDQWPFPK